jgi:hypothetical protein
VTVDGRVIKCKPVLNLTSLKLKGSIQSDSTELDKFFKTNAFNEKNKELIKKIFKEANENNFLVRVKRAK